MEESGWLRKTANAKRKVTKHKVAINPEASQRKHINPSFLVQQRITRFVPPTSKDKKNEKSKSTTTSKQPSYSPLQDVSANYQNTTISCENESSEQKGVEMEHQVAVSLRHKNSPSSSQGSAVEIQSSPTSRIVAASRRQKDSPNSSQGSVVELQSSRTSRIEGLKDCQNAIPNVNSNLEELRKFIKRKCDVNGDLISDCSSEDDAVEEHLIQDQNLLSKTDKQDLHIHEEHVLQAQNLHTKTNEQDFHTPKKHVEDETTSFKICPTNRTLKPPPDSLVLNSQDCKLIPFIPIGCSFDFTLSSNSETSKIQNRAISFDSPTSKENIQFVPLKCDPLFTLNSQYFLQAMESPNDFCPAACSTQYTDVRPNYKRKGSSQAVMAQWQENQNSESDISRYRYSIKGKYSNVRNDSLKLDANCPIMPIEALEMCKDFTLSF